MQLFVDFYPAGFLPILFNTLEPLIQALHGGVIGAFLEMTALAQLSVAQPSPRVHKTIDITIEYLRPGRAMTS